MKIKMREERCPACTVEGCDGPWRMEEREVDVSTEELLAELAKRRPCPRCAHRGKPLPRCCGCLWCGVNGKDNFKPSK